jgi:plastocyanin
MLKIIISLFITLIIVAGTVMSVAIIFSSDGRESERQQQQQSLEPQRDIDTLDVNSGVLIVSQDRAFNGTNPDIKLKANIPQELVFINKDSTPHDITVESLNIESGILNKDEEFKTTITSESGVYEYYCSLHPQDMKGKIIV